MNKKSIKQGIEDAVVTEAYRTARANIEFSLVASKCKTILISSPSPMDGKTTTAINLAAAFAKQVEKKALLIDCDLRRPRIKKYLNIKSKTGLSEYLCKNVPMKDLINKTDIDGLSVICGGDVPPNPAELLASKKMEDLVSALKAEFDYIIIDSPPLNVVTDALSVTPYCDGIAAIVREKNTQYRDIDKMLEKIEMSGAKMLGFILNGAAAVNSKKKYGYGYGYNSYHDYI